MKRNTKGSRDIKQIVTYWVLFSSDIIQYIYIYIYYGLIWRLSEHLALAEVFDLFIARCNSRFVLEKYSLSVRRIGDHLQQLRLIRAGLAQRKASILFEVKSVTYRMKLLLYG